MSGDDEGRGGIIRVQHDKQRPYFVMSKALAEDTRLTYAARGMMAYLLAKPDDWEIRLDDLIGSSPGGLRHVRSLLRELEAAGYLNRARERKAGGLFVWVTTVYESPSAQNVPVDQPSVQNVPMVRSPSVRYPPVDDPPVVDPPVDNVPIYQVLKEPSTKRLINKEPIDPIAHASKNNGGSDRIGSVGSLNIPTGDDGGSVGSDRSVLDKLRAIGLGTKQARNVLQKWPRTLGVSVDAWGAWIACHQHGEDGIANAVAYAYGGLMAGNLPDQADDADELAAEQRKREDAAKAREVARFAKPAEPPPPVIPIPENVVDPAEFRAAILRMREASMMPAPARPVNVYQTDGPDV